MATTIAYFHPELGEWCELHSVTETHKVAAQLADRLFQPINIRIGDVWSAEYPTQHTYKAWCKAQRREG